MTTQEALAAALQSLDNGERDVPDADALGFAAAIHAALSAAGYSIVSTEELEACAAREKWQARAVEAEAALSRIARLDYRGNPSPEQDIARAALEGAKP